MKNYIIFLNLILVHAHYAATLTVKNLLNRPILVQAYFTTVQLSAGFNLPGEKIGGAVDDAYELEKLQEGARFSLAAGQQYTFNTGFKMLGSLQWTDLSDNQTITWKAGLNTNKDDGELTIRSEGKGLYDWKKDRYERPLIKQKATKIQIPAFTPANFEKVIVQNKVP